MQTSFSVFHLERRYRFFYLPDIPSRILPFRLTLRNSLPYLLPSIFSLPFCILSSRFTLRYSLSFSSLFQTYPFAYSLQTYPSVLYFSNIPSVFSLQKYPSVFSRSNIPFRFISSSQTYSSVFS